MRATDDGSTCSAAAVLKTSFMAASKTAHEGAGTDMCNFSSSGSLDVFSRMFLERDAAEQDD